MAFSTSAVEKKLLLYFSVQVKFFKSTQIIDLQKFNFDFY